MEPGSDYFSQLGIIFLFIAGGAVFIVVTLLVARLVRPDRPNAEKLTTYESGENPVSSPWAQFNMRFYIVAIIFLLFEVEIVFLFPWATVFAKKEFIDGTRGLWGWFSLVEMLIFIAVLAVGLVYAWVNGHLEWAKPEQELPDFKSPVPKKFYEEINRKYDRPHV